MGGEPTRAGSGAGAPNHWYEPVAEFLGAAYLRNAFTLGTVQEVDFLVPKLFPGGCGDRRLLDAGCGPGRHSLEFARRGVVVSGVDISAPFVDLARAEAEAESLAAEFHLGDVREIHDHEAFDAVICLCQGGFGLVGAAVEEDLAILGNLSAALVPGGRLALSAFSAFFAATGHWEDAEVAFDPATGAFDEVAELRNERGETRRVRTTTTCFTARELRLMARCCGLEVEGLWGVWPGRYGETSPRVEDAELLMLARKPPHPPGSVPDERCQSAGLPPQQGTQREHDQAALNQEE